MLWIRSWSIRHMITWCGISGLESSKLLLQLLRCDTGSPTALCRSAWLFLGELPDTVVSALWETSAVARSGTANISQKRSLHAALSQQTLHLIPRVSCHDGYTSWHQRRGVRVLRQEWWLIKWITDAIERQWSHTAEMLVIRTLIIVPLSLFWATGVQMLKKKENYSEIIGFFVTKFHFIFRRAAALWGTPFTTVFKGRIILNSFLRACYRRRYSIQKNGRNKSVKHNLPKRRKKSGCVLNFTLPFLKLNTGNSDLPAQTLTGWNAALDVTKETIPGKRAKKAELACLFLGPWEFGSQK